MRDRVVYVSGPVDAEQVYREHLQRTTSAYYGTVYLAQLLAVVNELAAEVQVITTLPGVRWRKRIDQLTIINLPMPEGLRGAAYHLGMLAWMARCIREIVRFRASAVVLTAGQDYFWLCGLLRLFRVRLLASLHCTLWPKLVSPRTHRRVLAWLDGALFFPFCDHIQAVSQDIITQICAVSPSLRRSPVKFVPTYNRDLFQDVRPPPVPAPGKVFNLLYVGRLEANKGIFDLLEIIQRLAAQEPGRYHLDICGAGTALAALLGRIRNDGLNSVVSVHGQCDSSSLAVRYRAAHAVIVPTRSDFEEGYAKVAAEAVLNLRPLVTSAACPALSDVRAATMEARADDVADYVRVVRLLAHDAALFALKVSAAEEIRELYFDDRSSYRSILEPALRKALEHTSSARYPT